MPALPQAIDLLRLGRMPLSGERALVHIACREVQPQHAIYDFTVYGEDHSAILQVEGYQCVLLKANARVMSNV